MVWLLVVLLLLQLVMLLLLLLVVLLLELLLVVLLLLLLLKLLLLLILLLLLLWLKGAPLLDVLPLLELHAEAILRGGLGRALLLLEGAGGVDWSLVLVGLLLGPGPGSLVLLLLYPGPRRVAQARLLAVVLQPRLLLLLDLLL